MVEAPETRYAQALDGASIAYQVLGDGPVDLLWLEGYRGNLEVMWEQPVVASFFTQLASFSRLIRLDVRGSGLSDRGHRPADLETQVDDIRSVLDVVGSQRTVVAAGGWGTAPASLFASTFPGRCRGLVLFAASARYRPAPDYPWGFSDEELERTVRMVDRSWGTEGYAAFQLSYDAPSMAGDRSFVRWYAKMQRHWVGPSEALELERRFADTDIRGVLPTISVPTLVLCREWDDPEEDEHVAGLIPDARLVRLPGRDWMVYAGEQAPVIDAIRGFVGVEDASAKSDTVLQTVLFTDIVDSTQEMARLGDRGWKDVVERHHAIVRGELSRFRGIEVDTAGDGFYANFDGPARAIRCALEIVRQMPELGIQVRAGLHTGECEVIDDKCGGLTVSLGARVAAKAGPSEILVSQTVKDLVAGSGLSFADEGEHDLKGVPDRWRLYRVVA